MTCARTIVLLLYFIQGSLGLVLLQSPSLGIAGGQSVDITDAPFMAAIYKLYTYNTSVTSFWCGGSIVHERFVLTAASCIDDHLIVRVGSSYHNEESELHQVDKYIRHEGYSFETYDNDVALLKLSEPVTFSPSVATIRLADESVSISTGLAANVTGWGETKDGQVSRDLQRVFVTVSPPIDCDTSYYLYKMKLSDKQICVNNKGKGFCTFDRGGPLTAGDLQIGIVSLGSTCGSLPNVYAKVAPHLQWIRNKINENS